VFSLVSWYMSTNHLQEQQKKYKADIESAVGTLNQVKQTPDHPNDSTIKGMDAVMQKFGEDVYQAWTHLAENQEQVLVWKGIFADEQFQQEVRPLRPIETKVDETSTAINIENRRLYRDYIDDEIPKLADIILAKWQVDARSLGTGGMPGGAEAPAQDRPWAEGCPVQWEVVCREWREWEVGPVLPPKMMIPAWWSFGIRATRRKSPNCTLAWR